MALFQRGSAIDDIVVAVAPPTYDDIRGPRVDINWNVIARGVAWPLLDWNKVMLAMVKGPGQVYLADNQAKSSRRFCILNLDSHLLSRHN